MEYKGFIIKGAVKSPSLREVVTSGRGGKIPNCLGGMFTSNKAAMLAINDYLSNKGNTDGKAKTNTKTKPD